MLCVCMLTNRTHTNQQSALHLHVQYAVNMHTVLCQLLLSDKPLSQK